MPTPSESEIIDKIIKLENLIQTKTEEVGRLNQMRKALIAITDDVDGNPRNNELKGKPFTPADKNEIWNEWEEEVNSTLA